MNGGELFLSEEALTQEEMTQREMRRGWAGSHWRTETAMGLAVQNLRSEETDFIKELLLTVLQRDEVGDAVERSLWSGLASPFASVNQISFLSPGFVPGDSCQT